MAYRIVIFISHSWAYSGHYDKIHDWLCNEQWNVLGTPVLFGDNSVPRENPIHYAPNEESLRQAIYSRIYESDVVIIPTGVYATYSKWIGKEVLGAQLFQKPIIGVDGWGSERTSTVVKNAANEIVGWRKQSIADAVWRQVKR